MTRTIRTLLARTPATLLVTPLVTLLVPTLVLSLLRAVPAAQTAAAAPAPAAYTDRTATVNGLRVHFLEWGSPSKPALILLHGISKHAHTFDHIAPDFARDYHVLAVDMRGHGDSGWSPEGAYLVERLIVEDVGPERPQDIADSFARQVRQDADGWASEDDLVKQLVARNQRTPEALLRTYAHFGLKKRDDGRLVWKRDPNLVKGFVVTELWEQISKITSPTLYVIGGASRIVPAATQERLKQTLPNVEIVTMPGLGHYPNEENTAGFLAIVNPFLKR